MAQKGETLVEVKDLCKNFGVTIALSHVDFVVKTGEIRGLIGENGSGKSTVSSIIAGMQPASSGEMFYKGKPWKPATMLEAQKAGIGMIVQEAGTIANISVAENIFLGNYDKFKKGPIINKVAMISEARKALEKIGVTNINPALPARHYDMQERKLIEIAKCMYNDPELLIVDETTTALSQSGRDIIYRIMHEMADAGKAVTPVREYALFGYHSMPVGITDGRYTLLRDVKDFDEKTYEYTQMPTHMRAMFSVEEMRTATMAPGFSYTKGTPVMKIEARPNPRFLHTLKGGDMLFDLQNDPHQEHVLEDAEQSDRLLTAMTAAFEENDAPEEMYRRYGLKQYRKKAE